MNVKGQINNSEFWLLSSDIVTHWLVLVKYCKVELHIIQTNLSCCVKVELQTLYVLKDLGVYAHFYRKHTECYFEVFLNHFSSNRPACYLHATVYYSVLFSLKNSKMYNYT